MTPRRDREILVPIALYAESVSTLRTLASTYSGLNDEQLDWLELLTLEHAGDTFAGRVLLKSFMPLALRLPSCRCAPSCCNASSNEYPPASGASTAPMERPSERWPAGSPPG